MVKPLHLIASWASLVCLNYPPLLVPDRDAVGVRTARETCGARTSPHLGIDATAQQRLRSRRCTTKSCGFIT